MTKREQIILGLTVVVAILGAFIFFYDVTSTEETVGNEIRIQDLQKYVDDMSAKIRKNDFSDKDSHIIELATNPWERDPFSNVELPDESSQKKANTDGDIPLKYSGYVQIGNNLLAVINGIEYTVGEELGHPGYVVYSISPEKVAVKVGNRKMIYLPLEETM